MFKKKYLIKINFKSGISQKLWVYFFNLKLDKETNSRAIEYKLVDKEVAIKFIDFDAIESVIQLKQTRWLTYDF